MRRCVLYAVVLLGSAVVSFAQVRPSLSGAPHHGDVYAGMIGMGSNPSTASRSYAGGVDFPILPWITATGEVDVAPTSIYNGTNNFVLTDVFLGPRLFLPVSISPRVHPFVDGLVGLESLNNTRTDHSPPVANGDHFALAVDGGADLQVWHGFTLRPQVGYLYSSFTTNFTSPPSSTGGGRWRAGGFLVYRF